MNWLRRHRAPWGTEVWNALDTAIVEQARHFLAARHVADLNGPLGWEQVAVRLGTTTESPLENQAGRVEVSVPEVVLLAEIECPFEMPYRLVEVWERGGPTLDTSAAEEAAREMAHAEDRLVFYGGPGSAGFLTSADSPTLQIGDWASAGQVVSDVLTGVAKLDAAGVRGPYTLVLDEAHYFTYYAAGAGGYPVSKQLHSHVKKVVRSQVIRGGALFSTRGGDFILTLGGDLTAGYLGHDDKNVHLFVIESLAVQLITPQAVCLLK